VIIPKISSAWWGFTSATEHLKAFLRRIVHSRLCPPGLSDLTTCWSSRWQNCTRNIITENYRYYRKTLICLTAILSFMMIMMCN